MRRRWIAIPLAALLVLAALGVAVVSWRSADQLIHPERRLEGATPADVGLAYENATFSADAGALAAWWVPAEEARGTVLFLHGYGDSKAQGVPLMPFLHEAGYHVLAFDFRAHGGSEGDVTTVGLDEVSDVEAAVAFAQAKDPAAAEDLALLGFSMGGATALNAAAVVPAVDVVVADSAFATLTNIASNSINHFTDLPRFPFGPLSVLMAGWMVGKSVRENAPIEALASVTAPVLVIQGAEDVIAFPEDDGRALAAAAPPGSQLWLVPGAAHVQAHALAPAEYEARVSAFLAERLSD